jgi:hypothetical protein
MPPAASTTSPEDTPLELIKRVRPSVLVKGADYEREKVVSVPVVERPGTTSTSTTVIRHHRGGALMLARQRAIFPRSSVQSAVAGSIGFIIL